MKKKITMLFAALLACVGVMWAQPTENAKYRLKNNKAGKYLELINTTATDGTGVQIKNLDGSNDNQCFYFLPVEGVDDTYLIKSVSGRYLQLTGAMQWNMQATESVPDEKGHIKLVAVDGVKNGYYLQTKSTCTWGNNMATQDSDADGAPVYADKATSARNVVWTLEEFVEAVSLTVNYVLNGSIAKTETVSGFAGSTYTVNNPSSFTTIESVTNNDNEVASSNGVYSITIAGGETLNVNLKETLPFTTTELVDGSLPTSAVWHKVYMAAETTTWSYDTENNNFNVAAVPTEWSSAYMFAFVGNAVEGFKIYNKEVGASKILWNSASSINGTGTKVIPTEIGVAIDGNWILENGKDTYYAFRKDGVQNAYMNPQGGKLCYWKSASGKTDNNGGRISFVVVEDTELAALARVDFNTIFATAQSINGCIGEGVGYFTVTEDFTKAYEAACAINEESLASEIETATSALKIAVSEHATVNLPEEGAYYTLKNANTNVYMNIDANGGFISTGSVGIGEVFQFIPTNEGKFYFCNLERGTYLSTAAGWGHGQDFAKATDIVTAKTLSIAHLGKDNQVSLTPTGGATMHHDTNLGKIVGWPGEADSKSAWKIEEVDITNLAHNITITNAKWGTLVLGYDAIIPEGVTAYAVSSVDETKANLSEITGVIPAGEAVLLYGEAGTYAFKFAESVEAIETNLLKGSTINQNISEKAYILAAKNGIGLYEAAFNVSTDTSNDGTEEDPAVTYEAFFNNAFKAYLPATAAGSNAPAMFSLGRGEGTTGIEAVKPTIENVVIYDLAGRRVEKMEKGIYIVNGKKVIR